MKVIFSPQAEKQLRSLGKAIQIIIGRRVRNINFFQAKGERLKGYKNIFRARVGDYRLVYRKTSVEIYVVIIGHRREIYRLLERLLR